MADRPRSTLRLAIGWMIFPIIPVVLASGYYSVVNFTREDPRQWSFWQGVVFLGPLAGYGYLAGATLRLYDDCAKRRLRWLLGRRSIWLGFGPWLGFLVWWSLILTWQWADWVFSRILAPERLDAWRNATVVRSPGLWAEYLAVAFLAYGWLLVAWIAGRRARRQARLGPSIARGLIVAIGFLGSLMGGFWAATAVFRAYFFDPRIAQVLLIAGVSVFLLGGCGPPPTVGEVHRRELFQAMLMAWVLGLALVWRWLARERR